MSLPTLAHPEWTHAIATLIALAIGGLVFAHVRARRRVRMLGGNRTRIAPSGALRDAGRIAALIAIGIAALGPHLGERTIAVPSRGLDVVFVVDVSRSMEARDTPPTRIDRARRAVEELVGRLEEGDRAALVAFAARPLVLAPLTPDRIALTEILAGVEVGLIEPADSSTARGIEAALDLFEEGSDRPRAIVLASDGEDRDAEGDRGAARAARAEARILALAIGSEPGAHVPEGGGFLRDRRGDPVVTRRDAAGLDALAAATGGRSLVADEWGRFDFAAAARALREGVGRSGETVERRVAAARVIPFAAVAFAILWLGMLPAVSHRTAAASLLLPVILLAAIPAVGERGPGARDADALAAEVRAAPQDARTRIALGLARLRQGDHAEAAREFLAAAVYADEPEVAATAQYDLGVAALQLEDWERARDAFFAALALDPEDATARFNLEWTLAALRDAAETASGATSSPSAPENEREPEADRAESEASDEAADRNGADTALDEAARRAWLDRAHEQPGDWLRGGEAPPGSTSSPDSVPVW